MPLRPGNPFYFLFSRDDQSSIDATSLVVSDVPFSSDPLVVDPYPQSLQIRFSLKSGGRAPKLRPLGPGLMTFHFDPQPGLAPPDPEDAVVENYDEWPTVGRLRLTFKDPNVIERIKKITGLPVGPSDVWYSNVKITKNFLFETLPKLPITKVIADKKNTVPPNTPAGVKQIVSGFLKGRLYARLISGTQSSGDSQVTLEMPELEPNAAGTFDFYITTGFSREPFDGEKRDYENPNNVASDWEPAHPHNGIIPARLIYRNLRTHALGNMIDADAGNPVPDRILATIEQRDDVPEYYPVRFTRIWKPEEDCSVHFPSQVVIATHLQSGRKTSQRLPAHGVLFLSMTRLENLGDDTRFSIKVVNPSLKPERQMWWLSGGVANVWQDAAADAPVNVDPPAASQTVTGIPHIQLRRRMGQEIIYDRKQRPTGFGAACTFFSLRRTVRALVNNRIAGGRLNFEIYYLNNYVQGENSAATRKLVIEAIGSAASVVLNGQPNHRAGEFHEDDPDTQANEIGVEAVRLRPVLEKLFPRLVEPQDGPFPTPPQSTQGKVAYAVWQSFIDQFQDNDTRRLFADGWLGGGGAAAIQVIVMAADYTVNPGQSTIRQPGETDESFRSRIVEDMLSANLQPGAPLQFWDLFSDLDNIRTRSVPGMPKPKPARQGHSPIFLEYRGPAGSPTGMAVLDQTGVQFCDRTGAAGSYILPWFTHKPHAWIAANWME